MSLAQRIDSNIIAIIVSILFLVNLSRRLDKEAKGNRIFFSLFILNTFQLIDETLTCIINKQPYLWLIPITTIMHVFLFTLGPVVAYLWYKFTYLWVYGDSKFSFKRKMMLMIPIIINALIVFASPFNGLVFQISRDNVYKRGVLFFAPISVSFFYLLYSFIFIYLNRKKICKVEFLPLLSFGIFPMLGVLIQSLFYGILLMWSSISLSLVFVYIYLQHGMMQTDYLTGAWTREKFQRYLKRRIEQNRNKNFTIVFIDLDNFKKINDAFGHNEGDKALKAVVEIINKVLQKGDFITRYGGDEFVLFLNTENKEDVQTVMKRVFEAFKDYNDNSDKPYKLNFSYGYKAYDSEMHMSAYQYISYADELMYVSKNSKKPKV